MGKGLNVPGEILLRHVCSMTHSLIFRLATCLPVLYHAGGAVAQWLEQGTHNPLVVGSNPSGPSLTTSLAIYR